MWGKTLDFVLGVSMLTLAAAVWLTNLYGDRTVHTLYICESNLRSLSDGIGFWSVEHGGLVPGELGMLAPTYLHAIPTCASARADTYSGSYVVSADMRSYTIVCAGNNHARYGLPANFPQMLSATGLRSR